MKNLKLCVLPFTVALLLTACGQGEADKNFKLIDPENTSMLTANCKAYVDAMREQEKGLADPYKYDDLGGEQGVNIDEGSKEDKDRLYLDTGDPNGKNQTRNTIPDRSDKSVGIELKFEPKAGAEADEYKVLVSDNALFENPIEYTTSGNSVTTNNLRVNTEYFWKVVAGDKESKPAKFTTGDYPRWINARPLYNVRDLGGYMTSSGKRVKQGLVFRGGEITTMNGGGHYNTIADSSKEVFRNEMNIGVELDLRGASDISDGYNACAFAENGDIEYQQYAIKSYEQTFTQTRSMVAPIFEILKNANNKQVYFHCFGGADRTGTLGFLLNGVLGVSYTDLVIDFELTSYSSIDNEHIRCHIPGYQHSYDRWPALINQLKTDTTGGYAYDADASLKDNIEEFLVKACSVPLDTINTIRNIMLED
ncbi:MAG: tyrosine-protein phosphatase [Bacilli bacterium]|nr:tyrosine-protein phosphatase [Bacilli bacterium]